MPRRGHHLEDLVGHRQPGSPSPAEATRGRSDVPLGPPPAKSAAAIGDRQMLAVQTKRTRTGVILPLVPCRPPTSLAGRSVRRDDERDRRAGGKWPRRACGENVATNAEIVRSVTQAMERGDDLAVMAQVTRDVVWNVHAAEPDAAPWFGVYEGKRGVADFLDDLRLGRLHRRPSTTGLMADGDTVMTVTAPGLRRTQRHATSRSTRSRSGAWSTGRIASVDVFLDTAAVAAAFA